jgi:hypothetical protein
MIEGASGQSLPKNARHKLMNPELFSKIPSIPEKQASIDQIDVHQFCFGNNILEIHTNIGVFTNTLDNIKYQLDASNFYIYPNVIQKILTKFTHIKIGKYEAIINCFKFTYKIKKTDKYNVALFEITARNCTSFCNEKRAPLSERKCFTIFRQD